MSTRNAFVQRQHDEAKETLEKLRGHVTAIEEKLQEGGEAEEWLPLLDEARKGVAELEPVLADFDDAGVDPEELVQYAQVIEDWQMKEAELSKKLA
jgi:hypothetical protein